MKVKEIPSLRHFSEVFEEMMKYPRIIADNRYFLGAESETNWQEWIHHLYLFTHHDGIIIHDYPFKSQGTVAPNLVSGGLTGLTMLIQEITQKETKIKIVEQEDMTIILEHGKFLTGAVITETNSLTLRTKLKHLIQEVEDFFQEELENHPNNTSLFSKIGKFTRKIFEN